MLLAHAPSRNDHRTCDTAIRYSRPRAEHLEVAGCGWRGALLRPAESGCRAYSAQSAGVRFFDDRSCFVRSPGKRQCRAGRLHEPRNLEACGRSKLHRRCFGERGSSGRTDVGFRSFTLVVSGRPARGLTDGRPNRIRSVETRTRRPHTDCIDCGRQRSTCPREQAGEVFYSITGVQALSLSATRQAAVSTISMQTGSAERGALLPSIPSADVPW